MNLFGTILTNTAPSANYRGESPTNRAVIQKITKGRFEYAIISPESMRNAIRETLKELGLPCNRERLEDEEQIAVKFEDYPDADKYADDFFMGWLIAANSADRKKIIDDIKKKNRKKEFTFKRDSILRMNIAVALEPYRFNSVFTQSPKNVDSLWKNADNSQLLHREITYTAFQYPFALNIEECKDKAEWTKILLKAIGQLNNVAGNHARSYFEMAPASIVLRLTKQLVAGYDTYGFKIQEDGKHIMPEVIEGIEKGDFPGNEFYIGGKIIKDMDENKIKDIEEKGVKISRNPQEILEIAGNDAFKQK